MQDKKSRTVCGAYCVFWGIRVVIPPAGHERILTELHEAQPRTERMKELARSVVWWPSIDAEVEQLVSKCKICQMNRSNSPSAPLHPREWPKTIVKSTRGLCRTVPRLIFLVIVNAHSK